MDKTDKNDKKQFCLFHLFVLVARRPPASLGDFVPKLEVAKQVFGVLEQDGQNGQYPIRACIL